MDGPRPEEGRRHDRGRERRDHAPTDGDVRLGDRRHGRGLHQGCGAEAHLSPTGLAGFVLANGSMSLSTSGEGEIRKALIEADLVDCMVALPGHRQLWSRCLWARARDKAGTRIAFFNDMRSITVFLVFASWRDLPRHPHLRATPATAAVVIAMGTVASGRLYSSQAMGRLAERHPNSSRQIAVDSEEQRTDSNQFEAMDRRSTAVSPVACARADGP